MEYSKKKKSTAKNSQKTGNNKNKFNRKDSKKSTGQSSKNLEMAIDANFRMGIEKIVDEFMQG